MHTSCARVHALRAGWPMRCCTSYHQTPITSNLLGLFLVHLAVRISRDFITSRVLIRGRSQSSREACVFAPVRSENTPRTNPWFQGSLLARSWSPVATHQVDLGARTAIHDLIQKKKKPRARRPDALRIYDQPVTAAQFSFPDPCPDGMEQTKARSGCARKNSRSDELRRLLPQPMPGG
ncbi:hypothetical protein SEVIR_9G421901v4 [Setaria viridis]